MLPAYVDHDVKSIQTMSCYVDTGVFRQKYLWELVDFLPLWREDGDYHLTIDVYKDLYQIAKDMMSFPTGHIIRAASNHDSPVENEVFDGNKGSDGRFSDGDAEV